MTFEETKETLTAGFSPNMKGLWEALYGKAECEDMIHNRERSAVDRALAVQDQITEFLDQCIKEDESI